MKRFLLSVVIAGLLPITGCHYRSRSYSCGHEVNVNCAAPCWATTGPATFAPPAAVPYDTIPAADVPEAPAPVIRPAPVTEPVEAPKETIPEAAPNAPANPPAPAANPDKLKGPDGAEAAQATPFREIPEIEAEETERVSNTLTSPSVEE